MPPTRDGLMPHADAPGSAERLGLSGLLALLVHLVFLGLMVFALRWQTSPLPVVAEVWDSLPGPETPPPPAVKLEPTPEPITPAPPPPPPSPLRKAPEPPKVEPVPPPAASVPKPPPKPDLAIERQKQEKSRLAELEARHQREQAEAARREEDARREAEAARAAAQAAEQQRQRETQAAQAAAQQARAAALDIYRSQIMRAVRARLVEPPGIQGNPQAEVKVLQLPSGEVVQAKVTRPSGIPAYDEAVERAVLAASPLPLPADRSLFARDFTIQFRLRE